jgi:hypothetical protein
MPFRKSQLNAESKRNDSIAILVHDAMVAGPVKVLRPNGLERFLKTRIQSIAYRVCAIVAKRWMLMRPLL